MERFTEIFFAVSAIAEAAAAVYFFKRFLRDIFGADFSHSKALFANLCGKIIPSLLLTFSVMQLSFGIFNSLTCLISPLIIGRDPAAASLTMMLFNIFSLCTACIFGKKILCTATNNSVQMSVKSSGLTALTLYLFAAGLYVNLAVFGNTVDSERSAEIFRKSFPMLAVHCLGAAAVFTAVRTKKKLSEISFGAELALKQAEQAGERLKKTAVFRHDAKRHIAVLSGLLKKGENSCAEKYLSEIKGMAEELSKPFNTGCAAVDAVLESKLGSLERAGIKHEFYLRLPEKVICTAELCGVISNILDNAINACRCLEDTDEKFIRLRAAAQGNLMIIEEENSFDGGAFQKGIGLMSIENAAEKYGGRLSIKPNGKVFSVTVVMRINLLTGEREENRA